jgi:NADH dehydrogenase
MSSEKKTHIIILGGGFGGMYTALELEKQLARNADIEVTLVNRENFFLFTPMLHEVAASDLDLSHIVNPVRKLLRRVSFFDGDVVSIDPRGKQVTLSHGTESHLHTLQYDHLVLGLGAITNFNNLPGLEQNALTMKSLGDAIYLRNRLIENLETADFECNAELRQPLLTFVVAGGGFAGVETVAALNDFVREALRFYPNIGEEMIRVVLVHSGEVILPELGEKLGAYAETILRKRGVEIRTKVRVKSYTDGIVELNDGSRFPSATVVWTAGTAPNPMLSQLPFMKEKGRIVANEFMEVPGWPGVWAVGDCAVIPDPKTGKSYPPTAQHAIREGRTLAKNIVATMRGGTKQPFVFKTIGLLASIGRRTGVAQILGVNFSGFIAWWLWRTIYLSKLPRFEKKFRVALDWTLDILFSKDIVQFQTLRSPGVSHNEDGQELFAKRVTPAVTLPFATGTWQSHVAATKQ